MQVPTTEMPLDYDFFKSIYDAILSLQASDVDYVIDNVFEGKKANPNNIGQRSSNTGYIIKICAGYYPVPASSSKKKVNAEQWNIRFPTSIRFTQTPVVVANAFSNLSKNTDPVASVLRNISKSGFSFRAIAIDRLGIGVNYVSYIAVGY